MTNALATRYPSVAQQWHPTKNGTLTPREVTFGTTRKVWWKCVSGHEWQTKVLERTRKGYNCPQCRRHEQAVATTGRKRRGVSLAGYEGARSGPVRRVK